MSSLRQRVARWLLPAMACLLVLNAWYGQREARQSLNRAYDRGLISSAQLIAERTYSSDGQVVVDLPYAALDVSNERIFYGVFWPDGKVITGYEDLPHLLAVNRDQQVVDAVYRGLPVRLVVLRKPLYDPRQSHAPDVLVAVAETVDGRAEMAHELFLEGLRRQALLVCVGLLLMWVVITRALRPMTTIGAAFNHRGDDDLTPVSMKDLPSEVKPLIDAVNHHMQRIGAMLQARKRFVADAAHQLRTPLAVLRTQIDYGLRQEDAQESRQALAAAGHSVRHMQRLANQLLSLSSAEAINGLAQERASVDLVNLAREVCADVSLLAVERQIDLGFDPAPVARDALSAWGHAALLRELILNLLDNALRYTQAGGHVTVSVLPAETPGDVQLVISDDGPGIPQEERTKVFHRFYRILGRARTEGSGLGLAIVREIALAHGGTVSLDSGAHGRGLRVSVDLPRAPSSQTT